ncbi:ImmA/IrrE family metallo-endopeptidase [Leifsonia sp. SIMBA_070]|uniref:ImmA/IrrE family metallo-endopeptidase n=2 Tax=Bacillati TaxID=1783272 RepID=UPI0039795F6A
MRSTFDDTPAQVEAMIRVWESRGGSLEDLTLDAFMALQQRGDLAVLRVPEFVPPDSQLNCSVAGGYRWEPPTLVVTESMSRRRQQFTLLHELGHHIQKTDIELGTRVVEHREPEAFEDACCDAFAAQVLLPDDLVDGHISSRGPTVGAATDLFEASNASRAAICVRLANSLQSPGAVIVLNDAGNVTFAAARGGLYPPARYSDQTENPLVRAALEMGHADRTIVRDDGQIWYRDGHSSERLYGQAAWAGDRLFVIMVAYRAPWLSMSPPRDGTAQYTKDRWDQCEHCQQSFVIGFICRACGQPRCPAGHCGCTAKAEKTCTECFLQKHNNHFAPGSDVCLDCAS